MKRQFYVYRDETNTQFLAFRHGEGVRATYSGSPHTIRANGVPFYYTGQKYKVSTREQAIDAYKMWLAIK